MRRSLRAAVFAAALAIALPGVAHLPAASAARVGASPKINLKALFHDTRNGTYRSPFGAVPAGSRVALALRTAYRGATSVTLVAQATNQGGDVTGTSTVKLKPARHMGKYELWRGTFMPSAIGRYYYYFQVRLGSATAYYSSNALQEGGPGEGSRQKPDIYFSLTSYDPSFKAVSWAQNAVIYQIFPDRFYNGDPTNDHSGMQLVYGGEAPYVHTSWNDAPQAGGEDFFGGDLQGIIDKLPYIKGLGFNTIYLNPIFLAASNHKYDTADYYEIDPRFGTLDTFKALVAAIHANGMHLIMDGVFNHTGSDSKYFNRYGDFPDVGAFQCKCSPYYPLYTFTSWPNVYNSFFGISSLPQLNESDASKDFIFRTPDSVAQHWEALGGDGWRLDAAHLKSHEWWQQFRQVMKARFPDNIIICECDAAPIDATPWLLGNEMDGDMNYRFREAILDFFAGGRGTNNPFPTSAKGLYNALMSILQDYPVPAIESSMNLVDSHDTDRILYDLAGNKNALREVATLQMTWRGAPTVYYGDEAGQTGATDPDDRRTFPWDSQDTSLEAFYQKLIRLRAANPALRDGSVKGLVLNNTARVFSYERHDKTQSVLVVLNDGQKTARIKLKITDIKNGTKLVDGISGTTVTVRKGKVTVSVPASGEAVLTPGL